jgi:hypothetical protein
MAAVRLRFEPPFIDDLTKLIIYEGPTSIGPFEPIEEVTEVGEFPDYIHSYTTTEAASISGWFSIQWEDAKGAQTFLSDAIQGHTDTVPGKLVNRVSLRMPDEHSKVIKQEAEAVAEEFFGKDPYEIDFSKVSYKTMSGLMYLTMARIRLSQIISAPAQDSYTAGLVSQKQSQSAGTMKDVDAWMKLANRMLGRGYSVIAQMVVPDINRGLSRVVMADISRLSQSRGIVTRSGILKTLMLLCAMRLECFLTIPRLLTTGSEGSSILSSPVLFVV